MNTIKFMLNAMIALLTMLYPFIVLLRRPLFPILANSRPSHGSSWSQAINILFDQALELPFTVDGRGLFRLRYLER